jgi:hypothetical protein
MTVSIILTCSYLLIVAGSIGMVLFATKFPFSTSIRELVFASERLFSFNGHQVWKYSWAAIILGTVGQLIAYWLPITTSSRDIADITVYPVLKRTAFRSIRPYTAWTFSVRRSCIGPLELMRPLLRLQSAPFAILITGDVSIAMEAE